MEDRYSIAEAHNESNRLNWVSDASGITVVGLVDEEQGGIVAYVGAAHADDLCKALNEKAGR